MKDLCLNMNAARHECYFYPIFFILSTIWVVEVVLYILVQNRVSWRWPSLRGCKIQIFHTSSPSNKTITNLPIGKSYGKWILHHHQQQHLPTFWGRNVTKNKNSAAIDKMFKIFFHEKFFIKSAINCKTHMKTMAANQCTSRFSVILYVSSNILRDPSSKIENIF